MTPAEREAAILALLPKVQRIARHYAPVWHPVLALEDVVQEGLLGAIQAVEAYNPARGVPLERYADRRIVGAIQDAFRAGDAVPRSLRRKHRVLQRATDAFTAQQGRPPDSVALAQQAGIALETCQRWQQALQVLTPLSLDALLARDMDDLTVSLVRAQEEDGARDIFLQRVLADLVAGMPASERLLLTWYYEEELTMNAIAQRLGVTESRVCHVHTHALARLRVRLFRRLGLPADAEPPLPLADRPRRLLTPAERGQRRDKARIYLREWHTRRKALAYAH